MPSYKHGILMNEELDIPANREDLPEYQFCEWREGMRREPRRASKITFLHCEYGLITMTWAEFDAITPLGLAAFNAWISGTGQVAQ